VQKVLSAAVIGLLAALLVWSFVGRKPQHAEPLVHETSPAPATREAPAPLSPPAAETAQPEREIAPALATIPETKAPAPVPTPKTNDSLCELRGRFLFPGGAPASGVQLGIMAWESNQERVLRYGLPEKFVPPTGTSQSDGRFSMRFDPPRAYQFVLTGSLAGYCKPSWRWSEIEPGKVVDVGDVELVRGGSIRGRVVDSKGKALTSGWTVYGESPRTNLRADAEPVSVTAQPNATSGEFMLQGLPPGGIRLKAYSRVANWIEGPTIEVRAGEESHGDIKYSGPDISSRITVVQFTNPFYVFSFGTNEEEAGSMVLTAPGFEARHAEKIARSSQSWSFDDVPPGVYTVEIHHPRFLPWSKSGVKPGTSIDAHLKGNASVVLDVVDDASGEPVPHYTLDVRFDKVTFSPNLFRILEKKDDPPKNGLFDGLVPHDQTLLVSCEGYAPCEVPLPGLGANEQRRATARLTHGHALRGIIVQGSSKRPVGGAKIRMRGVSEKDPDSAGTSYSIESDPQAIETVSGAQGDFAFPGVGPGKYELSATSGPLLHAKATAAMSSGADPATIEIALPDTGVLVGRILGPEGATFTDLTVLTKPERPANSEEDEFDAFFLPPEASAVIAADGTFRSPPVPVGRASVSLWCPRVTIPDPHGSMSFEGGHVDLGVVDIGGGIDTRKEFDLRTSLPATVTTRVNVNGKPGASLIVTFAAEQGAGAVAVTDANGSSRVGPMLVDAYHVHVGPDDGSWFFLDPRTVTVSAGSALTVDIDVTLYEGTFVCKDAATHQPLANERIMLEPDPNPTRVSVPATTDADGRVHLTLQAARWRVKTNAFPFPSPDEKSVSIDWGPLGASPHEIELEITKK
jgi:hypothetical protein